MAGLAAPTACREQERRMHEGDFPRPFDKQREIAVDLVADQQERPNR